MKRFFILATMAVTLGCASGSEGSGDTEGGWDWDGSSSWGSGGILSARKANVRWSVSFDGVPTDLMRTPTDSLVAGHVDGMATVWRVSEDHGAEPIWSSDLLGRDAKFVRTEDGTVLVVALVPGGAAFAPLDGSAEPIAVPAPPGRSGLVGAAAGEDGELWIALATPQGGRVLRVTEDGTIAATHPVRDDVALLGILRDHDASRTVVLGNSSDGDAWEKCLPDDGTPTANVMVGWRATGTWFDGPRAVVGFDAGGVGCAMEVDCGGGGDDVEELVMPMPAQAAGAWSYGRDADHIVMGINWEAYTYDLPGELVGIEGDPSGLAVAVIKQSGRAHVVELAQP